MLALLPSLLLEHDGGPHTRETVLDVGFNIGQDTTMYLEAGYNVVAIEANPGLVAWANSTEPFMSAAQHRRLALLNLAIAPHEPNAKRAVRKSTMTFYMAMHTERSRLGVCNYPPCTAVEVETASCDALVGEYRPMYVKIDAEGADIVCLSAIFHGIASGSLQAPPRYISVEELLSQEMYDAAGNAGYTHFKYADQRNNHGGANHGAGTGAFGEFVYDGHAKYSWHPLASFRRLRFHGDTHMKHVSAWMNMNASNAMMQTWRKPATWPLKAEEGAR